MRRADEVDEPALEQRVVDRALDPAHPHFDAGALNALGQVAQRIQPGEVDVGDGIADEDERVERRLVLVDEVDDRLEEEVRVPEEDGCLEAHDQHALARLGLGMAVDVAMTLASGDLPQYGDTRAREAVQDGQQRDEHADQDPVEDPEQERAGERRERRPQLGLARHDPRRTAFASAARRAGSAGAGGTPAGR